MSKETMKATLVNDLKRMLPILGIVLLTGIAVTISITMVAHNHLHAAIAATPSACSYADLYFNAGLKRMAGIREKVQQARITAVEGEFASETLGLLQDDAEVQKARADFLRVYELCPSNASADANLAVLEWYGGNPAAAHYYLGTHSTKKTGMTEAERSEAAAMEFQRALEFDPNYGPAILHLALANQKLGQSEKAFSLIQGKESELAEETDGKSILGRLYGRSAEREKASKYLKEALRENPVDTYAIGELARLAREEDLLRDTADFFMSLAQYEERNIFISFSFAASFYRELEEYELEEEALRQALRLFSNSPDLNYHLSVNLWRQGRNAESQDYLRMALEHNYSRVMSLMETTGNDPRKPRS